MNVRSWQANIARDRGDLATARRLTPRPRSTLDRETGRCVDDRAVFIAGRHRDPGGRTGTPRRRRSTARERVLRRNGIDTWRPKLASTSAAGWHFTGATSTPPSGSSAATCATLGDGRAPAAARDARLHRRHPRRAGATWPAPSASSPPRATRWTRWRATLDDQALRLLAFQATATDESDRNSSVPRVIAALATGGRAEAAFGLAERRRARELGRRLYEASALESSPAAPPDARPATAAPPDAPATIAALLPDDSTALVEYVTGALGAPTTAFVVTRRGRLAARGAAAGRFADRRHRPVHRARGEGRADAAADATALAASCSTRTSTLESRRHPPHHRPRRRRSTACPGTRSRLSDGRYAVERYAIGIAPSAARSRPAAAPSSSPAPGRSACSLSATRLRPPVTADTGCSRRGRPPPPPGLRPRGAARRPLRRRRRCCGCGERGERGLSARGAARLVPQ